jgi:hypothetical protein
MGSSDTFTWQEVRDVVAEEADITLKLNASKSDEHGWRLDAKDFSLWGFAEGEDPTSWTIGDQEVPAPGQLTATWHEYGEGLGGGYYSVLRGYPRGLILYYFTDDLEKRPDQPPRPKWLPLVHSVLTDLTSRPRPSGA